jgi:PAS domain S-box-containing protein
MAATSQSVTLLRNLPRESLANILLVDDRPANLQALEAVLEDLGHNLVKAHSGEEALRKVLEAEFAVILLDVQMHGLDGFETAKLIRAREKLRHTPVIFLTAYDSGRAVVEEAYALGAVDYLVKPVVPVILRAKVSGFVELYQKAEQIKRQAEKIRKMEHRVFELRLAEENARLRQSEQRFTRFMQHLPGLAWIKDLQGCYVYVNHAAEKAFAKARQELYGKTDVDIFPAETAAQFREHDLEALANPAGVQVIESLQHQDGVVHHSLVSKFPIPGPDGKAALVGGIAIDITDRLGAVEALREADRRKDEFLAMLAHELRNPLAPIRNALEILKTPGASADVAEQAKDIMLRQVQHMARLVDDLVDVSRIMRDKIELRKERVELASIMARAVETAQPIIDAHQHELTVAPLPEPIWLEADVIRLAQVIANLLTNAAKYTEKGGHIWLSAEREGCEVVLRVKDTGIGIEPAMLPRIFGLFVQAERSLDRSQGGMGIGLALVRKLVEMHGGSVTALSAGPNRGSEFTVRLPASPEARHEHEMRSDEGKSTPAVAAPCLHILVVDDNRDAAKCLALLLRLEGHDVRVAHDGETALAMAQRQPPDLAFLDLGMPGMDGYELCRRMRAEPALAKVVFVALTGWGQEEDARRSHEAGFDRHLVKPMEPHSLKRLLTHPRITQP